MSPSCPPLPCCGGERWPTIRHTSSCPLDSPPAEPVPPAQPQPDSETRYDESDDLLLERLGRALEYVPLNLYDEVVKLAHLSVEEVLKERNALARQLRVAQEQLAETQRERDELKARLAGYEEFKAARTEAADGDDIWEFLWRSLVGWKKKFLGAEAALAEAEDCFEHIAAAMNDFVEAAFTRQGVPFNAARAVVAAALRGSETNGDTNG